MPAKSPRAAVLRREETHRPEGSASAIHGLILYPVCRCARRTNRDRRHRGIGQDIRGKGALPSASGGRCTGCGRRSARRVVGDCTRAPTVLLPAIRSSYSAARRSAWSSHRCASPHQGDGYSCQTHHMQNNRASHPFLLFSKMPEDNT
jgi:hypothetical protein